MKITNRPVTLSLVVVWMLLPSWVGSASMAAGKEKIGPSLQAALDSFNVSKDLSRIPGCFYKNGKAHIKVFVELTEIPDEFAKDGVEVTARSGSLVTAVVPLESVPGVSRLSQVLRLEAGAPVTTALDLSVPDIRADEVWIDPDWGVDQGEGVLVGMVDTGISLEHDNFRDAQGTRIQYIRDLSLDRDCDSASIDQQTCPQVDTDGHGTGVMGTMAGNGRADCGQEAPCSGVAPKAGLLVVKLGENPTSVDVAEAVSFLFSKADEMGMPVVVNLSLSWFSGPRDGSSPDERFISGLLGEGHIVVAAAGNQGVTQEHAEANLTDKKTAQAIFRLFATPPLAGALEGWYDWGVGDEGRKIEVRVSCRIGFTDTPVTDWMEFGEGPQDFQAACGSVSVDHHGETDRARGFAVRVASFDSLTVWLLEFQGTGFGAGDRNIDLWIDPLSFPTPAPGEIPLFRFDETVHTNPFGNRVESHRKTITPPCTADNVLCASSYNTRCPPGVCKKNLGLNLRDDVFTLSAFSSRGPRRDGALKPELGAPGQALIVPWVPGRGAYVTDSGSYAAGTSFSSAHLAGTVALMLHLDPLLTPEKIRAAISVDTVQPWVYDDARWNDDYRGWRGYGRLDAFSLVDALFSLPDPPSNLVAEMVPTKRVRLSWDPSPSADITLYRIYWDRGSGSIDYGLALAEVDAATTTFASDKLRAGLTYAFGVRAVNQSGEEKNTSAQVTIQVPAPVPPGNLHAQVINFKQVQLTWDASTSAEAAFSHVYWDGGSGQINDASPLAADVTSWLSGELGAGTYLFKVAAADADLEEDLANSPTVSATVFATLGSEGDDFCFIASAAFADPNAPEVNRLREFRDAVLMKTSGGRQFVAAYYRLSPPVAAWLKDHRRISGLVRLALRPMVGWAEMAYHRGLKGWTGVSLFLTGVFFLPGYFWFTRKIHQS